MLSIQRAFVEPEQSYFLLGPREVDFNLFGTKIRDELTLQRKVL